MDPNQQSNQVPTNQQSQHHQQEQYQQQANPLQQNLSQQSYYQPPAPANGSQSTIQISFGNPPPPQQQSNKISIPLFFGGANQTQAPPDQDEEEDSYEEGEDFDDEEEEEEEEEVNYENDNHDIQHVEETRYQVNSNQQYQQHNTDDGQQFNNKIQFSLGQSSVAPQANQQEEDANMENEDEDESNQHGDDENEEGSGEYHHEESSQEISQQHNLENHEANRNISVQNQPSEFNKQISQSQDASWQNQIDGASNKIQIGFNKPVAQQEEVKVEMKAPESQPIRIQLFGGSNNSSNQTNKQQTKKQQQQIQQANNIIDQPLSSTGEFGSYNTINQQLPPQNQVPASTGPIQISSNPITISLNPSAKPVSKKQQAQNLQLQQQQYQQQQQHQIVQDQQQQIQLQNSPSQLEPTQPVFSQSDSNIIQLAAIMGNQKGPLVNNPVVAVGHSDSSVSQTELNQNANTINSNGQQAELPSHYNTSIRIGGSNEQLQEPIQYENTISQQPSNHHLPSSAIHIGSQDHPSQNPTTIKLDPYPISSHQNLQQEQNQETKQAPTTISLNFGTTTAKSKQQNIDTQVKIEPISISLAQPSQNIQIPNYQYQNLNEAQGQTYQQDQNQVMSYEQTITLSQNQQQVPAENNNLDYHGNVPSAPIQISLMQPSQPDYAQQMPINQQYLEQQQQYGENQYMQSQNYAAFPNEQGLVNYSQAPHEVATSQEQSKKKKRKKKVKQSLMDYYTLVKSKVTMEIDPVLARMRSQILYTLVVKEQASVDQLINSAIDQEIQSIQLDLSVQAKMMTIIEVSSLNIEDNTKDKQFGFSYPEPFEQAQLQNTVYSQVSRDLHTLELKQRLIYENEQVNGLINVRSVARIDLKKKQKDDNDVYSTQLRPKLKILVSAFIEKLTDVGIRQVHYRAPPQDIISTEDKIQYQGSNSTELNNKEATYFYTSDGYDAVYLWLPIIQGTSTIPIDWTLRYIIPNQFMVISSGVLANRSIEDTNLKRVLFVYKAKGENKAIAQKLGFICGSFPSFYRSPNLSRRCKEGGFISFFATPKKMETFKHNSFYERILDQIIGQQEKLLTATYPIGNAKLVFVPNLFLQRGPSRSRKQSLDFACGLHILDEELLFEKNILENRYQTYKYLACALAYDYFGNKIYEESGEDFWLLLGIRESLGNHFKVAKCGILLYRYHIMQTIRSLYRKMKQGVERYSLQSSQQPHPNELLWNEMVYEKAELIMHMLESMIDKSYYEKILRALYHSAKNTNTVSTGLFLQIFKDVCGFKLNQFCQNWIMSTSCPKLTASFNYNKKNNSLDLQITQSSVMKYDFMFRRYLKQNIDCSTLFTCPLKGAEMKLAMQRIEPIDSFFVELKRECMRWFTGEVNLMIYLTDGAEVHTQQQKMALRAGKTTISMNIPLQVKVKKTIQNKKKEYENMMAYDEEMSEENEEGGGNNGMSQDANGGGHHMVDNSQWKFGLNDYELEEYPYKTKNLFEVKNLESPVLWIRVDPDMEYIRKVEVVQEKENWLFQLLQEKDIIGQVEAIRHLYKFNDELVYEILKAVSISESYFFKVRKEALWALQKMQTSKFNQFLSHEKFLTKIFNFRNFDAKIGFYKANDFTRILEYYMDKYILGTLAKCKDHELRVKEEIREQQQQYRLQLQQQQDQGGDNTGTNAAGGAAQTIVQINFGGDNDIINTSSALGNQKSLGAGGFKPTSSAVTDESEVYISSEALAQMLIRLLQENDNSQNPFDDSYYLKKIIGGLGQLDCFKLMPEIATEIYRQFKLDNISQYSSSFAITIGAIKGFFGLKKQIYRFKTKKVQNIDPQLEDLRWYDNQIEITQTLLAKMDVELENILNDRKWSFEARVEIMIKQIKHSFLYSGFTFLKALYIQLKKVDSYQAKSDLKFAVEHMKQVALFVEQHWERLDYREAYLNNPRSVAIINVMWSFICLPHAYLDQQLTYWVKRLYSILYNNDVPYFMKEWQASQGIQSEQKEYDEIWIQTEDQFAAMNDQAIGGGPIGGITGGGGAGGPSAVAQSNREKHFNKILSSRSAQVIIRTPKAEMTDQYAAAQKQQQQIMGGQQQNSYNEQSAGVDPNKLKIVLGGLGINNQKVQPANTSGTAHSIVIQNPLASGQQNQGPIKILLGTGGGSSTDIGIQQPISIQTNQNQYQSQYNNSMGYQDQDGGNQNMGNYNDNRQTARNTDLIQIGQNYDGGANNTNNQLVQDQANNMVIDNDDDDEDESIYDEFAEIKFDEPWLQRCWDVLGLLWYHEEATAFLYPVTEDDLGEYFMEYLRQIQYPMDISTIKQKMIDRVYTSSYEFKRDVQVMFQNCKIFNQEDSDIYQSAIKLENLFWSKIKEYGLQGEGSLIRIV